MWSCVLFDMVKREIRPSGARPAGALVRSMAVCCAQEVDLEKQVVFLAGVHRFAVGIGSESDQAT